MTISPAGTLMRLGLDQLIFAPIFIAGFQAILLTVSVREHAICRCCALQACYCWRSSAPDLTCMRQGERHQIRSKLDRDLKDIVITNWKIWIPFQFFNFGVVPQRLQVRHTHFCHLSHGDSPECQHLLILQMCTFLSQAAPADPASAH